MGLYTVNAINEEGDIVDMQALQENFIYTEVAALREEEIKEFLKSERCKALEEAGVIGRKTIVRLSKIDDLSRRTKIACFQLAKEKNDPLWTQLVKNRVKEKELISKLKQKYGNAGRRNAITGQKALIKAVPNIFTRPIGR